MDSVVSFKYRSPLARKDGNCTEFAHWSSLDSPNCMPACFYWTRISYLTRGILPRFGWAWGEDVKSGIMGLLPMGIRHVVFSRWGRRITVPQVYRRNCSTLKLPWAVSEICSSRQKPSGLLWRLLVTSLQLRAASCCVCDSASRNFIQAKWKA